MTQIRRNIIANYAGSIWNSLMGIIFIPLYIKFMGIEAYALVGVFGSLMALFGVLDLGLSATMTREMARLSAADPSGRDMRELARTLEVIYWGVALILGAGVLGLAGPIATYWVKPEHLAPEDVRQALMITGGVVALRWPVSFYAGGLSGLDRQPLLNLIQSFCATLRGLGAVGVLWFVSPTIQAFFVWQIVVSSVETSCLGGALWRSLPGSGTPAAFRLYRLKRVWSFSAGMTGIALITMFLTQTDKIILSTMLPLDLFGYYTLAWTVSYTMLRLIYPINAAVYPTMARLVAQQNEPALRDLYHKGCQTQTVVLVPAALTLTLFGDGVLALWSGDSKIVQNTYPIVSVLAIGMCLNGFMHMPYLAQLAHGWTSLTFYQNLVSVIVLVPLMVVLTKTYQVMGAAYVWVILNGGYVLIAIYIMHGKILKGVKKDWYLYDIGLPTVAAAAVGLACRVVMPHGLPNLCLVLYVGAASGLAFLVAVCCAPFPRCRLLEYSKNTIQVAHSWLVRLGC